MVTQDLLSPAVRAKEGSRAVRAGRLAESWLCPGSTGSRHPFWGSWEGQSLYTLTGLAQVGNVTGHWQWPNVGPGRDESQVVNLVMITRSLRPRSMARPGSVAGIRRRLDSELPRTWVASRWQMWS